MLDNIKNHIMSVFYKFGYKMGSMIGMLGSGLLGSGFASGLSQKMSAGIAAFTAGDTFGEMIDGNMGAILADFMSELSGDGSVTSDTLVNASVSDTDIAGWEADAEAEMAALMADDAEGTTETTP